MTGALFNAPVQSLIKMKSILFLLVYLVLSLSGIYCQQLKIKGKFQIRLPANCGFRFDASQLFYDDKSNETYLCLLYRDTRTINCYNFETGELKKTITFMAEGPNGIGYEAAAFYIDNFENIFLYSYWEHSIFLTNEKGEIRDRIQLPNESGDLPMVEPGNLSPLIKVGDELFLTGRLTSYTGKPVRQPILALNAKTKKITSIGISPFNLGSGNFDMKDFGHFDYAPDKGYFIFDVGMSDSVYLVRKGAIYGKPAKSSYLKPILPIGSYDAKRVLSKAERIKYQAGNTYLGVKYDPHRQVYYRFAVKPDQTEAAYRGEFFEQVVMILDLNLNIIDEIELPKESVADMCFVGPKGLYIANHERYQNENDNYLYFDVYNFSK